METVVVTRKVNLHSTIRNRQRCALRFPTADTLPPRLHTYSTQSLSFINSRRGRLIGIGDEAILRASKWIHGRRLRRTRTPQLGPAQVKSGRDVPIKSPLSCRSILIRRDSWLLRKSYSRIATAAVDGIVRICLEAINIACRWRISNDGMD